MRLLLAIAFCCAAGASQAASNFTFEPEAGPHGVGVRVSEQYDYARNYRGRYDIVTGQPGTGETARPVQTLIWYPAQKSGKHVAYGDYMRLQFSTEKFGMSEADVEAASAVWLKQRSPATAAKVTTELTHPMLAVRDAKAIAGKYPVVIYAPSFSATATENADLCEYLASHGYVVIASPSLGARAGGMTTDVEGIEAQAADIAFLIGYARTLPQADLGKLAVAGYSWGGISNVFVAARDNRVKALVNLDGSVRYWPEMIEQAKYVRPSRVTVPMLFLAARPRSLEDLAKRDKPVVSFLNDLKYSDLYLVTLPAMEHFAFSSESLHLGPDSVYNDYSAAEVGQAHGWMARYVLQFLNATLLDQTPARTFLANTPQQNKVPPHVLTVVATKSKGPAPTREILAAEAAKTNFENVDALYADMRKSEPTFALEEMTFNEWGYKLLAKGDKRGALAILKLAVAQFPESGNAYDSLAEAYEVNQDKPQAIENYRRSLKLNPKNQNAVEHLKALGAPEQVGLLALPE